MVWVYSSQGLSLDAYPQQQQEGEISHMELPQF